MPVQLSRPFYHTDIQEPQQTVKHACFSLSSIDKKKKRKEKKKASSLYYANYITTVLTVIFLSLRNRCGPFGWSQTALKRFEIFQSKFGKRN